MTIVVQSGVLRNAYNTYTHLTAPAGVGIASGTSTTFAAQSIGTAATNRIVVVCVTANTGDPITGITIGGIVATKAVDEQLHIVSGMGIWYATVPTGTTADIIITTTTIAHDIAIVVGNFYSGVSTIPANTQKSFNGGSPSNTITLNTTIPAGGFAVMAAAQQHASQTVTWTNMTSSTGDAKTEITGAGLTDTLYVAHSITSGSPTALVWTVPSSDFIHVVSASWGP